MPAAPLTADTIQHHYRMPSAPLIDPTTGLPVPAPEPQWIDPNWTDPDIVLTNVSYDGLPLSEVARNLRERFKDRFNNDSFDFLPMPKTFDRDWGDQTIQLQLNNVRASDIFKAMNLVFENERTPVRWELSQSVTRAHHVNRWVMLRVLPEAAPTPAAPQLPQIQQRRIFYVGDLVGDEKSGGMTMDQVVKTVNEVWDTTYDDSANGRTDPHLKFHKEAQLLIFNGTMEQANLVQETLSALRQKVMEQRSAERTAEARQTAADARATFQMRLDQVKKAQTNNTGGQ